MCLGHFPDLVLVALDGLRLDGAIPVPASASAGGAARCRVVSADGEPLPATILLSDSGDLRVVSARTRASLPLRLRGCAHALAVHFNDHTALSSLVVTPAELRVHERDSGVLLCRHAAPAGDRWAGARFVAAARVLAWTASGAAVLLSLPAHPSLPRRGPPRPWPVDVAILPPAAAAAAAAAAAPVTSAAAAATPRRGIAGGTGVGGLMRTRKAAPSPSPSLTTLAADAAAAAAEDARISSAAMAPVPKKAAESDPDTPPALVLWHLPAIESAAGVHCFAAPCHHSRCGDSTFVSFILLNQTPLSVAPGVCGGRTGAHANCGFCR